MDWKIEIPLLIRTIINDFTEPYSYSDERLQQIAVVSAQYVRSDIALKNNYTINISEPNITPDPCLLDNKDINFINFISLKSACFIDQSSCRTRMLSSGIKTTLGPALLDIDSNMSGFQLLLEKGPCFMYDQSVLAYNIGNTELLSAILSPFVGNNFDPQMLNARSPIRNRLYDY